MAQTIGSIDLASLKNLRDDVTQYFWFESNSSSAWGSGAHVTLYPESQFTDSTNPNYMKGQNIIMNTDGFSIRNGGLPMMVLDNDSLDFNIIDTTAGTYVTAALFSSTGARIGQIGESRLEMNSHSMRMVDRNGNSYLYVSDLRDSDGKAHIIDTFTSNGSETAYYLTYPATSSDYTVTVSDGSGGSVQKTNDMFVFADVPTIGATITAEYDTESEQVKAYTIGMRGEGNVGASSTVIGTRCVASDKFAYADGYKTKAEGSASHAEGFVTTASGDASHSEGYMTEAIGDNSHSEGYRTKAEGAFSHAQNVRTIAGYDYQTVIGWSNDNQSNTLFEIGNGDTVTRSNAFTVDWDGKVDINNAVGSSNKAYINIRHSSIDSDGTTPTASVYSNNLHSFDVDGTRIGHIESVHDTNNDICMNLGAARLVNGSMVYNSITAKVSASGAQTYAVSSPANFRKAIHLKDAISFQTASSTDNSYTAGQVKTITITNGAVKSGCTAIAIRGWNVNASSSGGANPSGINVFSCLISGNNVVLETKNNASSAAKVDFYVYVTFIENY